MNDATQAISVGQHLREGEGIRTGIIFYEEQYASGEVPAPQTVFPPGYPVLIAIVMSAGLSAATAAYVVVSFCFAAVAVLILCASRRMHLSFAAAMVVALCWCGCVQCWSLTRGTMSELPFIAFTLLSLLLFPTTSGRRHRWLFLSGCAATAAFTMRYAGVFWFITVAAYFAVSLRRQFWQNLTAALTWGGVPLLTVAALFWRNHQLSGEWTGGNAIGTEHPLSFTLIRMYYSASQLVGWAKSQAMAGGPAEVLLALSIVTGIIWLVVHGRHLRIDRNRLRVTAGDPRLLLSAGYFMVTMFLLTVLDARSPIGLGARKLLPLLPFTLLVAGALLQSVGWKNTQAPRRLFVPACLLLLALIYGQVNVVGYINAKPSVATMIDASLQKPLSAKDTTLQSSLEQQIRPDAPLLTNEPHQTHLLLRRPVLGLPEPRYTDRIWTAEEARRMIDAYGVQQIALFRDVLAVAEFRAPFFEALDEGRVPPWLTPQLVDENVLLFSIAPIPHDMAPSASPAAMKAVSRPDGLQQPSSNVGNTAATTRLRPQRATRVN